MNREFLKFGRSKVLKWSVIADVPKNILASRRYSVTPRVILTVIAFAMTMTGWALTEEQVAQTLHQAERQERALQAERQQAKREAYAPKKIVAPQARTAPAHTHAEKPEIKNAGDAQRWLASPEMAERMKGMERVFNENLPALNAMMANNPAPGRAFTPLEPIKAGDIQRAASQAVTSGGGNGGGVKIPQFEALEQWREAMMAKMTNAMPQKMPAVPKMPAKTGGKR